MEGKAGVHHLGLATLDIDRTVDFYTRILGWKVSWCDILEPPEGGRIKHVFMDTGDGTLVAFIQYAEKFFMPLRDISTKYTVLQSALAASERIQALMENVRACSLGQITSALYEVGGQYRRNM